MAHIKCAPHVYKVTGSVLTHIHKPPVCLLLRYSMMNNPAMNGKSSVEEGGGDGGGIHHVAAKITLPLALVKLAVIGTIPSPH